ncbi:uncharacterized protein LOC124607161 [Schistocerca americana]|uniref:uncharacterized protein LOC124607161 n=1 Tax=Schistocerca americana TaxID=7009 RepID=UPI001F4FFE79|nr:uncharacterized protein LOC124607161 [Schistocerca americana]
MAASASSVTWLVILSVLVAAAVATPRRDFKGVAAMDDTLSMLSTECDAKKDSLSCVKYKVLTVIEQLFRKESFKVSDGVTVVKNDAEPAPQEAGSARGSSSWVDAAMELVTGHDLRVQLPGETTLVVSPRALDTAGEVSATLQFDNRALEGRSVEEARKSKLKKIIVPVLVFVLLKAITLVPLLVGALGLKAWNALQLSFFSFIISVALAVFQLCKKLASDAAAWPAAATVSAHAPWEPSGAGHQVAWGRAAPAEDDAQRLAYRGYAED